MGRVMPVSGASAAPRLNAPAPANRRPGMQKRAAVGVAVRERINMFGPPFEVVDGFGCGLKSTRAVRGRANYLMETLENSS
jgi:hypothetical protein